MHERVSEAEDDGAADWVVLSDPRRRVLVGHIPTPSAVLARMVAAALVVSLLIGALAFVVSQRLAEKDTLDEGVRITDILSGDIAPQVDAPLLAGDQTAISALDSGVLPAMNRFGVRRIKVFDLNGKILYSDEHRLIGESFPLGSIAQAALSASGPIAEVSSPSGAENQYEKVPGLLIEVRQALTGPRQQRALVEVYLDYNIVGQRATQMWRAFLAMLIGSLFLLTAMVVPVAFQLLRRIAEGAQQREDLLQRALDASDAERRRIAGSLHDGPVQELVGNTLALSGASDRLQHEGHVGASAIVSDAAGAVRRAVASLRSLLVELYPASLDETGIDEALDDLLAPLRARRIAATLRGSGQQLDASDQRLIYRVAQECLRNVGKHARATAVGVTLEQAASGWICTISDNGHGFDVAAMTVSPEPGHLGLRVLSDVAGDAGASLRVRSGPDGTRWELRRDNA